MGTVFYMSRYRWRKPAGALRLLTVPIRFVLASSMLGLTAVGLSFFLCTLSVVSVALSMLFGTEGQ